MSVPAVSLFFITFSVLRESDELTDVMAESKDGEVVLSCWVFTTMDQSDIEDKAKDLFHLLRRLWNDPALYYR